MTRALVFAAVSGLLISTAFAQAPPTLAPASNSAPSLNLQLSDELLASKLKGTAVLGPDGQKVGDITDVLFDTMGRVKAYIVSVGGFLGLGAKEVALEQSAFHEMPGTEGRPEDKQFIVNQLRISMTKNQLKEMAEFKPRPDLPSATGTTRTDGGVR